VHQSSPPPPPPPSPLLPLLCDIFFSYCYYWLSGCCCCCSRLVNDESERTASVLSIVDQRSFALPSELHGFALAFVGVHLKRNFKHSTRTSAGVYYSTLVLTVFSRRENYGWYAMVRPQPTTRRSFNPLHCERLRRNASLSSLSEQRIKI
jgi:hypothetical protein